MSGSAACRILVLASTVDKAQQFVQRVKTIASARTGSVDSSPATHTSDTASTSIPWTISNKYYTADVHFETRQLHEFASYHAGDVPAVIYVWHKGEPHKEQVLALAQKLQHNDPEVLLAVRFSENNIAHEEDEGLDEFLSSHGFEYVDGDRGGRRPTVDGESYSDEDSSGVPGLPRVIDALSTVMWPSIIQSASTSARKSRARELLDWAHEEEADDGLRALISQDTFAHDHDHDHDGENDTAGKRKSRMQREMEELQRWLEDEDASRQKMDDAQAWRTRSSSGDDAGNDDSGDGAWTDMPTPTIRTPATEGPSSTAPFGIEDDFAEFVGAPVEVSYGYEAVRQEPMYTGASYHSLASASDIAMDDLMADDEHDPDMPSRAEIEETSRRIFGSSSLDVPSSSVSRTRRSPTAHLTSLPEGPTHPVSSPSSAAAVMSPQHAFELHEDDSFDSFGESEDEDFELGAFDLSRVLGALQGMKEEIAGITDEGERRKAAARVALGLVYGLRKEDERERGPESSQ